MLLVASVIAVGFGFISLFDNELAWSLHEADSRLTGTPITRTKHWETLMMLQGFALIILGGIGIMVGLGLLGA